MKLVTISILAFWCWKGKLLNIKFCLMNFFLFEYLTVSIPILCSIGKVLYQGSKDQ